MSSYDLDQNTCCFNDVIGYGSFSIIYKGFSYKHNNNVAIKKINKLADMRYFNNEIQIMKKVNHPNVLKLYNAFQKDNNMYLILEYCNDGDLSKYISSNIHKYDHLYFYQILEGLEYLYSNNILHRDIKPQNILICNNNIKISDFGLAKSFEKTELITTFCGSPLYMAPEIIKNKCYTNISDIWSLGVVLYELLIKKHPYNCDTKDILWTMAFNNTFNINFEVLHINYKDILTKLLVYDYNERITWEELFNYTSSNTMYEEGNINIPECMYTIDDIDFTKENNLENSLKSKSVIVSSNINHSVNKLSDLNNSNHTDFKIFSNSAPKHISTSYFENYIKNKNTENSNVNNMPILGSSPNNRKSFNNILDKSIGTLKNLLYN